VEGGIASFLVAVSTFRGVVMSLGRSFEEIDLSKEVAEEGYIQRSVVVEKVVVKLELEI
jgi:hypothetical protein